MIISDATHAAYPDATRKEMAPNVSEILKRSATCAGGDKYTYVKKQKT